MGVRGNNRCLRPAVLIVICLLHGSLIVVLVRAKALRRTSEPVSTIYLIVHEASNAPLPRIDNAFAPNLLRVEPLRVPRPELPPPPSTEATSPVSIEEPPTVDWLAEAQRSAADIADREGSDRAEAAAPSLPAGSAPWDPHARLLEPTGHGLKVRIPVHIPLKIIDHCFSEFDSGQTPYGPEERLKMGCALRKQPARGDLFDSLRKGQPKE
jgi:hypothetical protein